jgi:hypothetical protein
MLGALVQLAVVQRHQILMAAAHLLTLAGGAVERCHLPRRPGHVAPERSPQRRNSPVQTILPHR